MNITKIEFERTFYQCRVVLDNTGNKLIIGGASLLDALQPGNFEDENEGFANMEASKIYDEIFFFTNDNDLSLDDADLISILQKSNPEWF